MDLRNEAKYYLQKWFSVIPVGKNKIPLINWKEYQERFPTEEEIDKWFDEFPDAQIGAVTWKISWIMVIDVEKWWDISWVPETATSKTGWGGYHFFYKFSKPFKNKTRIRELTDIRWEGGYVMMPPSISDKWEYKWIKKVALQIFPYWLFEEEKKEKQYTQTFDSEYEWVNEWWRNDAMARYAWHLVAKIHPTEWTKIALPLLMEANQKNEPPLPDHEVKAIFDSITSIEKSADNDRWYKKENELPEDSDVMPFFSAAESDESSKLEKYSTWFNIFDWALEWWMAEWDLVVISGSTWHGKCLWKWTDILMFDWTLKKVEDISVWDIIMWDDSTPRNVLSLARWRDVMYDVIPVKWDKYTVNESHILSLKRTWSNNKKWKNRKWEIVDIELKEYLTKSKSWKHLHKWYRAWVNFSEKQLPISPYFLWLWLWDWDSRHCWITTNDEEIVNYLQSYSKELWMKFVTLSQPEWKCWRYYISRWFKWAPLRWFSLWKELSNMNLLKNKHIPHIYKTSSRQDRLELLAWLIDSDWNLTYSNYEITQRSEKLSDDIVYLARSLWFASYKSKYIKRIKSIWFEWEYYRVIIAWDCSVIPVRIKRKKANKRRHKKDVLVTWIKIVKKWMWDYYWFELDGNKRFLLWDFTVTHNTETTLTLTYNFASQWIPVLYFSYEVLIGYLLEKFKKMWATEDMPIYCPQKIVTGNISWVEKKVLESKSKYWIKVVVIDHLWFLMPKVKMSDMSWWNYATYITQMVRELKQIAVREKIIIVLPVHMRKTVDEPSINDLKDSSWIWQEADEVFIIIREKNHDPDSSNYYTNHSKIKLEKNRKTWQSVQWWFTLINWRFVHDEFYKKK